MSPVWCVNRVLDHGRGPAAVKSIKGFGQSIRQLDRGLSCEKMAQEPGSEIGPHIFQVWYSGGHLHARLPLFTNAISQRSA
jgi:hypothetical protein